MKRALLLAGLVAGLFIIAASQLPAQDPLPTQHYVRVSLHLVVDPPDEPTKSPTYMVRVLWQGPFPTREGAKSAAQGYLTSGITEGDVLYPPSRLLDMTFITVE